MIAQHFAVVGREHNERIITLATLFEHVQELARRFDRVRNRHAHSRYQPCISSVMSQGLCGPTKFTLRNHGRSTGADSIHSTEFRPMQLSQ